MQPRARSIAAVQSLFQAEGGGSTPTLALQLFVHRIDTELALKLNQLWHSRLPRMGRGCVKIPYPSFAATFDDTIYAVAIWSNPVARILPQREWLELRRFAIGPDAPKNTASRMLAVMARLIRKQFPHVTRLISYQDTEAHAGTIYKAVGWIPRTATNGHGWDMPGRRRPKSQSYAPKIRWEKML